MAKEENGALDTVNTTTQGIYRILEIVYEFILFHMIKTNSKMHKKFIPSEKVLKVILKVSFKLFEFLVICILVVVGISLNK